MLRHNILGATRRCDATCALDRSLRVAAQRGVAPRDYQFLPGEFSNLQIQLRQATESTARPRKLFVCKSAQTIPISSVAPSVDTKYPVVQLKAELGAVLPPWTVWAPPAESHPRFAQPLRLPAHGSQSDLHSAPTLLPPS